MIRLKTIHIEEFRGIKKLALDLGEGNFGIYGPNGTGKSGVADAIEFCLTGSVNRLSGEGQGELSVGKHAPHVDSQSNPEQAKVEITAQIPFLNKNVIITRSVKSPTKFHVTPAGGQEEKIIKNLQAHPEFALSRREIVKYIIAAPGQRATDVQNLLRLDKIDNFRKALTTFKNNLFKEAQSAEDANFRARRDLETALEVAELNSDVFLKRVNEHRKVLGHPSLKTITSETIFNDATTDMENAGKSSSLVKSVALNEINIFMDVVTKDEPQEVASARTNALAELQKMKEDKAALAQAQRHEFIKTGLDFVTEDSCPLCDKEWVAKELREHLNQKLLSIESIGKILEEIEKNLSTIEQAIGNRVADIRKIADNAKTIDKSIEVSTLEDYVRQLESIQAAIEDFQKDYLKLDPAIVAMQDTWWTLPEKVQSVVQKTRESIKALPDTSVKDNAIKLLAVLQDRYNRLIKTDQIAKERGRKSALAAKVYNNYVTTSKNVLESIYDTVADKFSEFYRDINDDESKFVGELKSEGLKLNFHVDFYGRGAFPPGAYHSEGHQDGMGLCLYLALMQHTLGDKFTFAVLDDVLMSVDTGHRREVCRLLKTKFPNTQFILTTHDQVWLKYMKTENLISKSQIFGDWSVEFGPRVWDEEDIWEDIERQLEKNDVPRAAWLLRRYLEYISSVLADNLRAQVEFRGDGNHDLGDLLPPVLAQWKKRLTKGIKVAADWGNDTEEASLIKLHEEAKTLIAATNVDLWIVNRSVHFNEWVNLEGKELKNVINAHKTLLDHIHCSNPMCGSLPYLTPRKGPAELLRCNCGDISVNLKEKKAN